MSPSANNSPSAVASAHACPDSAWPPTAPRDVLELARHVPKGIAAHTDPIAFEMLTRIVVLAREGTANSALVSQARLLMNSFAMTPQGRLMHGLPSEQPKQASDDKPKTGLAAYL